MYFITKSWFFQFMEVSNINFSNTTNWCVKKPEVRKMKEGRREIKTRKMKLRDKKKGQGDAVVGTSTSNEYLFKINSKDGKIDR